MGAGEVRDGASSCLSASDRARTGLECAVSISGGAASSRPSCRECRLELESPGGLGESELGEEKRQRCAGAKQLQLEASILG